MTTLLAPPTTEKALREHAALLQKELEQALAADAREAQPDETDADAVAERDEWFAELRSAIRALTKSPIWRAHDLARELLVALEDLRDAVDSDPAATDPEWREREALMRMRVVVQAMVRQLEHHAIDQPEVAAGYVVKELAGIEDATVARLLATSPRMIGKYREGVGQIRKEPDRVTLVGQLVYELSTSMTPRGVALWFDAPREALAGATPLELIEADVAAAHDRLMPLARGSRAQLDTAA